MLKNSIKRVPSAQVIKPSLEGGESHEENGKNTGEKKEISKKKRRKTKGRSSLHDRQRRFEKEIVTGDIRIMGGGKRSNDTPDSVNTEP